MNQIISKKVVQSTIQVSENIDFILYMLAHLVTKFVKRETIRTICKAIFCAIIISYR